MNVKAAIHVMRRPRNALIPLEITLALVYWDTVGITKGAAKVGIIHAITIDISSVPIILICGIM